MEKIKEKPARSERIEEKVVSAPKELLHKRLDDGAERLRTQLRDTAQQGQRDEYGGDDIEDTAVSGSKRAAAARTAGIRPRTGAQGDAADEASADGAEQTTSEYITRSRHFGSDRYSTKCGGSFTQKY